MAGQLRFENLGCYFLLDSTFCYPVDETARLVVSHPGTIHVYPSETMLRGVENVGFLDFYYRNMLFMQDSGVFVSR